MATMNLELSLNDRGGFPALPFLVLALMFLRAVPRRNGQGTTAVLFVHSLCAVRVAVDRNARRLCFFFDISVS